MVDTVQFSIMGTRDASGQEGSGQELPARNPDS